MYRGGIGNDFSKGTTSLTLLGVSWLDPVFLGDKRQKVSLEDHGEEKKRGEARSGVERREEEVKMREEEKWWKIMCLQTTKNAVASGKSAMYTLKIQKKRFPAKEKGG